MKNISMPKLINNLSDISYDENKFKNYLIKILDNKIKVSKSHYRSVNDFMKALSGKCKIVLNEESVQKKDYNLIPSNYIFLFGLKDMLEYFKITEQYKKNYSLRMKGLANYPKDIEKLYKDEYVRKFFRYLNIYTSEYNGYVLQKKTNDDSYILMEQLLGNIKIKEIHSITGKKINFFISDISSKELNIKETGVSFDYNNSIGVSGYTTTNLRAYLLENLYYLIINNGYNRGSLKEDMIKVVCDKLQIDRSDFKKTLKYEIIDYISSCNNEKTDFIELVWPYLQVKNPY